MSDSTAPASTVPDFFQDDSTDALRAQADWLIQQVGLDDQFFAKLVGSRPEAFARWRTGGGELPPGGEECLRGLWQTVLHLLSFLNSDTTRVRELFLHTVPGQSGDQVAKGTPPWAGTSLKNYLESAGGGAVESVDRWVTAFRVGGC